MSGIQEIIRSNYRLVNEKIDSIKKNNKIVKFIIENQYDLYSWTFYAYIAKKHPQNFASRFTLFFLRDLAKALINPKQQNSPKTSSANDFSDYCYLAVLGVLTYINRSKELTLFYAADQSSKLLFRNLPTQYLQPSYNTEPAKNPPIQKAENLDKNKLLSTIQLIYDNKEKLFFTLSLLTTGFYLPILKPIITATASGLALFNPYCLAIIDKQVKKNNQSCKNLPELMTAIEMDNEFPARLITKIYGIDLEPEMVNTANMVKEPILSITRFIYTFFLPVKKSDYIINGLAILAISQVAHRTKAIQIGAYLIAIHGSTYLTKAIVSCYLKYFKVNLLENLI